MEPKIENVEELADTFVRIAAQQGDGDFDYSIDSIAWLDHVLGGFHAEGNKSEDMQGAILVASCYLGEVIRRHAGGEWLDGETADVPDVMRFPLMMRLGETIMVPFSKVWKRIENGAEDDLSFYFDTMVKHSGRVGVPSAPRSCPAPTRMPPRKAPSFLSRLLGRAS